MSIFEIKKKYIPSNSGTTLVELVVAMTLTAILATAVVSIMAPASRVFTQVKDLSRAQMTADLVVEALRQECADTYIEDFASVRIVNTTPSAAGDEDLLETLNGITSLSDSEGNILIIRKNGGYCEAIYSCLAISPSNYQYVKDEDQANSKYANGVSSKAVYRFFEDSNGSRDTLQGYVHYGYYQCGRSIYEVTHSGETKYISCIFPGKRFDYTNPFTIGAYNGYTVSLQFSELSYRLGPGETIDDIYTKRPESVKVTVSVYKCDYEAQNSEGAVYTRTATLVFAEDTTTK